MKLIRAISCWGNEASPEEALELACEWGFEAVEGPAGELAAIRGREGKEVIADIVTGCDAGSYVPRIAATPDDHLADFRRQLDAAQEARALRVTALAGCDFWDFPVTCRFYESMLEHARRAGAAVCFETHRARPTFHPLRTARLLEEFPGLVLTLDVSHWCVACERLVPAVTEWMKAVEAKVGHVHARVGYDQGPQVPDPRAERYREELEAHLACWRRIAGLMRARGCGEFTVTPEFGPDGYQQRDPRTGEAAGELREINRWTGRRIARDWQDIV